MIDIKRTTAILAVLLLTLTGCAGLNDTAKGEESFASVAESQEDATIGTDTSEAIPSIDGNISVQGEMNKEGDDIRHAREPLDRSRIPSDVTAGVIDWAETDWGIVAIMGDDTVRYFKDGVETYHMAVNVSADSFIFDASTFNQNAKYRWYAYINGDIFRIIETATEYEMRQIADYGFTGINWYSYSLQDYTLYFWSPSTTFYVDSGVDEVYTKLGYTFYRKDDRVYVIDANAYTMGRQTQSYTDMHEITPVCLGQGSLFFYYNQLNPRNGESNSLAATADFEERYGLDTMIWGNPIDFVNTDLIVQFATDTRTHTFDHYDVPVVNSSNQIRFENISFNGHLGHLRVFYKNEKPHYVSWTSYVASKELYQELLEYLRTLGPAGETLYPRNGQIEESAVIDGLTIYAGYEDTSHGHYTYIWANYSNR